MSIITLPCQWARIITEEQIIVIVIILLLLLFPKDLPLLGVQNMSSTPSSLIQKGGNENSIKNDKYIIA